MAQCPSPEHHSHCSGNSILVLYILVYVNQLFEARPASAPSRSCHIANDVTKFVQQAAFRDSVCASSYTIARAHMCASSYTLERTCALRPTHYSILQLAADGERQRECASHGVDTWNTARGRFDCEFFAISHDNQPGTQAKAPNPRASAI